MTLLPFSKETKEKWGHLTEPRYRLCLEGKDPDGVEPPHLLLLGIERLDTPQALAICGIDDEFQIGEIFSFKGEQRVMEPLLIDLEKQLKIHGCQMATIIFPTDTLEWPFIKSLMQSHKWLGPRPFMEKYFFDCYTFNPKWFQEKKHLPKEYSIFPWQELKEVEKRDIQHLESQGHFFDSNSPFYEEEQPEPKKISFTTSFGLRFRKKIVGWSITHFVAKDTIRYTTLFVNKEHLHSGASIELLKKSIRAQQNSKQRWSLFEVNLLEVSPSWVNFVHKRLSPYAIARSHFVQFWK